MNTWVILAVVVGALVLATVLVIGMMGGPGLGTHLPEELLPQEIAGFELVNRFDYVEPIFEGERYSTLVSFAPLEGMEFAGKVERMGITAYLFKDRGRAEAAKRMLLDSVGPGTGEVDLDGRPVIAYGGPGQAGLIWQMGPIIYQVFVTSPEGGDNPEALEKAALAGARAVFELWKR
ncbi:TPA: hypothetical protein EYP12_02825 [Candidatus Bipolaricaulota bacterium]|nr:hypothetical protein [Candidatus Bipolaricaulota bacterium]